MKHVKQAVLPNVLNTVLNCSVGCVVYRAVTGNCLGETGETNGTSVINIKRQQRILF